ncbi:hypothetical protein BDW74DRAFT_152919 [Aspergillus multicolor]|uniref:uncharacterized protein n=1 Tax=Aspergillus multicolor TaxID=41759 RepID=UPI003CCE0B11
MRFVSVLAAVALPALAVPRVIVLHDKDANENHDSNIQHLQPHNEREYTIITLKLDFDLGHGGQENPDDPAINKCVPHNHVCCVGPQCNQCCGLWKCDHTKDDPVPKCRVPGA